MKLKLLFLLLLSFSAVKSQITIRGKVYNARDSSAVAGASVYFDGSSIGTSTLKDGSFEISLREKLKSHFIISSIGFKTVTLQNVYQYGKVKLVVYLQENNEELPMVFLENDPWTREKKLKIFREQFIGSGKAAEMCEILNDSILNLNYNPNTQRLTASATRPLIIKNEYLDYLINYNLVDFHADFKDQKIQSVFYAGTSYFNELKEDVPNIVLRKRQKAYLGSSLHFMRSLINHRLKSEKFQLFLKRKEITLNEAISLKEKNGLVESHFKINAIRVCYNEKYWSKIIGQRDFIIDQFGNFSPPDALLFSGYISTKRISEMVPLNYN